MQCPRCGAPDVRPPLCDVCGASLPTTRPDVGRQRPNSAAASGGRRPKPAAKAGTLASFFSSTAKGPAEPGDAPSSPRANRRGGILSRPLRPSSRSGPRENMPKFPAMHEQGWRASHDAAAGAAPAERRGNDGATGRVPRAQADADANRGGTARVPRVPGNASGATNARIPASRPSRPSRPSLRDDAQDPWMRAEAAASDQWPPDDGFPAAMAPPPMQRGQRTPRGMMPGPMAQNAPPMPMQRGQRTPRAAMPNATMQGTASGPMMPGMMPMPNGMPGMTPPGGGRRPTFGPLAGLDLSHKAVSALVIVGVIVVLAIPVMFGLSRVSGLNPLGQSAQSAATRVPPAQAPSGFVSFVGDAYSVAYPSSWTHSTKGLVTGQGTMQADVFGDGHSTQAMIAVGDPVPTNQLQSMLGDVTQRYFAPNLPQTLGLVGPKVYGGVTWVAGDYTIATGSLGSQTVYELRVLAANLGAQTVVVVLQAKQQDFGAADTASFGPLIQSFRFG